MGECRTIFKETKERGLYEKEEVLECQVVTIS